MGTNKSFKKTKKFIKPDNWWLLYWPNQFLSAMMVVGSMAFASERLFDSDEPLLLKIIILVLIGTSLLYFAHLQIIKAAVEDGQLKTDSYKFFEPIGYLLVVTACSAFAFLLYEASYISNDLKLIIVIFYTLFLLHGFLMFKLSQLRKLIPLKINY